MQKEGSYSTLLKPRILRGLLSLSVKGYFVQKGWLNAYLTKQAISADGEPIPWLTYSFLDFLDGRLNKALSLFEYGSGNSTLFFAKQIQFVRSIEHDEKWYNKIKSALPSNAEISYVPLENQQYETVILQEEKHYDIVLVDGRERLKCLKNAVQRLTPQGVILLDDAERSKYEEAFSFMKSLGFKYIPFSGIAIGAIHDKQTVVFYKEENCLGI
ncbi:FkbM family methyltransferase [Sphingobacterium gobiense]|nr:FkbM family methyltransferase [Sphingobacterium gobiense]